MSPAFAALAGVVVGYVLMTMFQARSEAKRQARTVRRLEAVAESDAETRALAARVHAGELTVDEFWRLDCAQAEQRMRRAG